MFNILDMINDIILYGANAFATQISNLESSNQRKNGIDFVTNQFLTLKDFSEKLNSLSNEILNLLNCENLEDLMRTLSKSLKSIISSEEIRLWVCDSV